jgi:hypothetical protein
MLAFVAVLFLATATPEQAFGAAEAAAASRDFDSARELYRLAMERDPDPKQRDLSALRLAKIEWRIDHDAAAAKRELARVRDDRDDGAGAWIERARIESELIGDFAASREAAQHAQRLAKQDLDRFRATLFDAVGVVEPIRRARLAGRCQASAQLAGAQAGLEAAMAKTGPLPAAARLLLNAALLDNDGPAALAAWRGYYGVTAKSSILAPAAAALAVRLSQWRGVDASAEERRAVGLALADSRFFDEAAMVLGDPCAHHRAPNEKISAYAAALRKVRDDVEEYYRLVALHRAKPADLRTIVDRALPPSSRDDLGRRFGTIVVLGNTGNTFDLHLAHRVLDEEREVTQYGKRASLHFIVLDGVISNGFGEWVTDGRAGDGGWADKAIYQVRPRYAAGPYILWSYVSNPESRAHHEQEMAEELKRDEQRIVREPNLIPRGEAERIEEQYLDRVLATLRASGLAGDALRDAFVAKLTTDQFETSIWAHEGRHAIDKKYDRFASPELEFRAKLSEVVIGPAPRRAIDSISFELPPTSPHGIANRRIGAALAQWMKLHAKEIAGLDVARPMLTQVEKLTDDQMRAAFRSIDPLAK